MCVVCKNANKPVFTQLFRAMAAFMPTSTWISTQYIINEAQINSTKYKCKFRNMYFCMRTVTNTSAGIKIAHQIRSTFVQRMPEWEAFKRWPLLNTGRVSVYRHFRYFYFTFSNTHVLTHCERTYVRACFNAIPTVIKLVYFPGFAS